VINNRRPNIQDSPHVTTEELQRAVKIAARIVAMYGDPYLPIFNRLHDELMKRKESSDAKAVALNLAKQYAEME
jgi:hypothetical protein